MQRRDPRGFFEGVMADVPDLSPETKEQLLGIVNDKTGTKRAARIAAILSGLESPRPASAQEVKGEKANANADSSPPTAVVVPVTLPPATAATEAPRAPAPTTTVTEEPAGAAAARAAKPKRSRAKKAAAPPPPPKGNLNPFAGEIGDDEEVGQ